MQFSRHKSREYAVQALYQLEMLESADPKMLEDFWKQLDASGGALEFSKKLVAGCIEAQEEIDAILVDHLQNWKLSRLSVLVRNLLRMAVYEMQISAETPYQVVIDETLELSKDFVDETSTSFINSVLQKIHDSESF